MVNRHRKEVAILRALEAAGEPVASGSLAEALAAQGLGLTERTVRNCLQQLDDAGLTRSAGRRGREITAAGRRFLAEAEETEAPALVSVRMEELAYETSLDLTTGRGAVGLNLSLVREHALRAALHLMGPVFAARLTVSDLLGVYPAGRKVGGVRIPEGWVGIGTVCAVTVDGLLLKAGIPVHSEFGGLLEIADHQPARFTEVIEYEASSLDPLEVFIQGGMTSVTHAAVRGEGRVGAGFRTIPATAREHLQQMGETMRDRRLWGLGVVGRANCPLLEIPVPVDRIGIVIYGGMNPIAAVQEAGIPTENQAMKALVDYSELVPFEEL